MWRFFNDKKKNQLLLLLVFLFFYIILTLGSNNTTAARSLFDDDVNNNIKNINNKNINHDDDDDDIERRRKSNNSRYPRDVSGSFKGQWYTHLKSDKELGSGSVQFQLRQQQQQHQQQQHLATAWVEGDLHIRNSNNNINMFVTLSGVYLEETGIIHGRGESRNLDANVNTRNEGSSEFRESLRSSAEDITWQSNLMTMQTNQNQNHNNYNNNKTKTDNLDEQNISLFDMLRRRQRLNSLFSSSSNLTGYPHACVFALKLFIEPGNYSYDDEDTKKSKTSADATFDATVTGTLISENCGHHLILNSTTFKVQEYFAKAIKYAVIQIIIVVLQIYFLAKQVEYSGNNQSSLSKLSLLMLGFQSTIDAYLCLAHLVFGMVQETIFPAFACVAFLQFVLFSMFEMRLLLHVWKMRNASNLSSWMDLRRELSSLYAKFYAGAFGGALLLYALKNYQTLCVLILASYWVPQIGWNLYNNSRKPLSPSYICLISLTRLFTPLYFFAFPTNFAGNEQNVQLCGLVTCYVFVQASIVLAQHFRHPRVFTFGLTKWLPEVHNYHKNSDSALAAGDCSICLNDLQCTSQMLAPCGHRFHSKCLSKWMDVKLECPICRAKLPPI